MSTRISVHGRHVAAVGPATSAPIAEMGTIRPRMDARVLRWRGWGCERSSAGMMHPDGQGGAGAR